MFVDLHIHSTFSDGTLTPAEIVRLASQRGLKAISLTDHDTLNGVEEAAKEAELCNIKFLRGCEMSSSVDGIKVHILGYFPSGATRKLIDIFEIRRQNRHVRMKKICENLRNAGLDISYEDVVEDPKRESPGRANVAEALMKKGIVSSIGEGFDKFLIKGKAGYVESVRVTPVEAVSVIKENGGKAFVAHLNQIKTDEDKLFSLLKMLKTNGLDGIEGYYSGYTEKQFVIYREWAEELSLMLSGGSDFHGLVKPDIQLGSGYGDLKIPYCIYEEIIKC